MDFFSACKDKEEAKKVYRTLAKCFHPDKGGNNELMMHLKQQYERFEPKYNDFNQKKTTFYDQVFSDARYQYNTINRNGNIPFDHPIHGVVRNLNMRIELLEKELYTQKGMSNQWYAEYLNYEKMYEKLCEDSLKTEKKLKELKELKKMTVWEFIKFKWSEDVSREMV